MFYETYKHTAGQRYWHPADTDGNQINLSYKNSFNYVEKDVDEKTILLKIHQNEGRKFMWKKNIKCFLYFNVNNNMSTDFPKYKIKITQKQIFRLTN